MSGEGNKIGRSDGAESERPVANCNRLGRLLQLQRRVLSEASLYHFSPSRLFVVHLFSLVRIRGRDFQTEDIYVLDSGW
jgi:hypothetical protein